VGTRASSQLELVHPALRLYESRQGVSQNPVKKTDNQCIALVTLQREYHVALM
jgi:hypothetical protein